VLRLWLRSKEGIAGGVGVSSSAMSGCKTSIKTYKESRNFSIKAHNSLNNCD
jgi:hypothetical protein